jgi:hypothetical protein
MEKKNKSKTREKNMKAIMYCIAIMLLAFSVSSCSKKDNDSEQSQGQETAKVQIVPVPNQGVLVLDAGQIAQILTKAGFSEKQISDYGPSIREALAKSGAVRIMINNVIEAGLAVKGDDIYISTRSRGYFIYNTKTGWKNMQNQQN